ncbi:MAG: glycogen/starch synthase [Candidatus Melainabacteria bacterium]|nr:glycogen/starch synthase [Candidatus Melainabacteria bacterium]
MNVIFITPECEHFARLSEVGDFVTSLARAVEREGHNVKVFIPRYGCIDPVICHIERLPFEFKLKIPTFTTQAFVYKGILPNSLIGVFLIESQNYFSNSKEIYLGGNVDEERFNFFSMASLEVISELKFEPHVIHIINPLTSYVAKEHTSLRKAGVVFTIHDIYGLSNSLIKATNDAILHSNITTIASKAFLKDILEDNELLIQKKESFIDIESAYDTDFYNPEKDNFIAQTYSKDYFSSGKRKCKEDLLGHCELEKNIDIPLFGMHTPLLNENEFDIFLNALPEIVNLKAQFLIIGRKNKSYEHEMEKITNRSKNVKTCFDYDFALSKKLLAGSDFFLSPDKYQPSGMSVAIAMRYGSVPICYRKGAVKDMILDNGILFHDYSQDCLVEAINIAIKYYKNKERWTKLVKQAMSFEVSTQKMAQEYIKCYEKSLPFATTYYSGSRVKDIV